MKDKPMPLVADLKHQRWSQIYAAGILMRPAYWSSHSQLTMRNLLRDHPDLLHEARLILAEEKNARFCYVLAEAILSVARDDTCIKILLDEGDTDLSGLVGAEAAVAAGTLDARYLKHTT